jgi:1,2-phenylacetyl-CoA epoxidase catalytic subunit
MNSAAVAIALADDLFVQCQTLSPWTVNYVDLEESLAIGSISQELLAQGGVLYEFAGLSDEERDKRIFQRSASDWNVASLSFFPSNHWPDVVATAYVTAQASGITIDALCRTSESADEQLKLIGREQALHLAHWSQWISLLLVNNETKGEISAALNLAVEKAGDLLPLGEDYDLLHERWAKELKSEIAGFGLSPVSDIVRSGRVSGGSRVELLIQNLRSARDPDGLSSYSIY